MENNKIVDTVERERERELTLEWRLFKINKKYSR